MSVSEDIIVTGISSVNKEIHHLRPSLSKYPKIAIKYVTVIFLYAAYGNECCWSSFATLKLMDFNGRDDLCLDCLFFLDHSGCDKEKKMQLLT